MKTTLLTILLLTTYISVIAQYPFNLQGNIDGATIYLDSLPIIEDAFSSRKYEMTYDTKRKEITIANQFVNPKTGSEVPKRIEYKFKLKHLDQHSILLSTNEADSTFGIVLNSLNKKSSIRETIIVNGKTKRITKKHQVHLGNWNQDFRGNGAQLCRYLIYAVTHTVGADPAYKTKDIVYYDYMRDHRNNYPVTNNYAVRGIGSCPLFNGARNCTESSELLNKHIAKQQSRLKYDGEGITKIKFIVDTCGYTKDIVVTESHNTNMDHLLMNIIIALPRFTPVFGDGVAIESPFRYTFEFKQIYSIY